METPPFVRACPQRIISHMFTNAAPAAMVRVIGKLSIFSSLFDWRCYQPRLRLQSGIYKLAKRREIGISRPSSEQLGCIRLVSAALLVAASCR
jgi:hypothetical protein